MLIVNKTSFEKVFLIASNDFKPSINLSRSCQPFFVKIIPSFKFKNPRALFDLPWFISVHKQKTQCWPFSKLIQNIFFVFGTILYRLLLWNSWNKCGVLYAIYFRSLSVSPQRCVPKILIFTCWEKLGEAAENM